MKILVLTLTSLLCLVPTVFAQERFKPGLWERTEGTNTNTVCLTAAATASVNGPPAAVRAHAEKSAAEYHLTLKNFSFDGTTILMTMTQGDKVFITKSSYHGDTYESTVITKAGGKDTTKTIKGKRVGPCP